MEENIAARLLPWNIEAAMRCAPSLERCIRRLRELT